MKKLLTLALAIIALAVFAGLSIAQGAQQKDKQKNPPPSVATKPAPTTPPAATAKNSGHATEQVMTGTVTEVNAKAQTFTVKTAKGEQFTFSAKAAPLPKKEDQVAVTYIQTTPGGPLEARRYKEVRSQQGRAQDQDDSPKVMTGTVTEVNEKAQTFTLKTANGEQFTFSAKAAPLPKKEEQVDVTYTQPIPGGPMVAKAVIKGSKSNNLRVAGATDSPKVMTGKVTRVDEKAQNFTIKTAKGEQFTFSAKAAPLPKKDEQVAVTYTEAPDGSLVVKTIKSSTGGTISENGTMTSYRAAPPQVMTGKVLRVNPKEQTFTIMTKGKEVTFSAEKLKGPLPKVGEILDITYTQTPGGPLKSIALNSSRSNIY
jgi:hypothetical protein